MVRSSGPMASSSITKRKNPFGEGRTYGGPSSDALTVETEPKDVKPVLKTAKLEVEDVKPVIKSERTEEKAQLVLNGIGTRLKAEKRRTSEVLSSPTRREQRINSPLMQLRSSPHRRPPPAALQRWSSQCVSRQDHS